MNPERTEALIYKILQHFKSVGGYKFIPHDIDDCFANPHVKLLELIKMGGPGMTGNYHSSLSTDECVTSSTGKVISLQPLPIKGLYWISRSQDGYNNAHIAAHVHSWGGDGKSLFAFVGQ